MTVGERCRIVTRQNGETNVGTVIYTPDEAQEQLALEASLHSCAGWDIEIVLTGDDRIFHLILTGPKGTVRRMWVETFDPLHDKPPADPDDLTPRPGASGLGERL